MIKDTRDAEGFTIAVSSPSDPTVVAIRGDVDLATAPELARIINAEIDKGHQLLVLDLTDMHFMDCSGLLVIAQAAQRVEPLGGAVTLRSSSALVRRMLGITGLDEIIGIEPQIPSTRLGTGQSSPVTAPSDEIDELEIARNLRRALGIASETDVVDSALRLVVALARTTVSGADGVSVSLQRHGHLSTVASSDQTILDMDAIQYSTGEGPCVAASAEGRGFHAENLATESRWPAFTPRARTLGISSILSTPLIANDQPVGALNIYSRNAGVFADGEKGLAAIFAAEASIVVAGASVDLPEDEFAKRLRGALRSREVIAQAQGVLMERDGLSEQDAYIRLQRFSQETSVPLYKRAEDVVASAQGGGVVAVSIEGLSSSSND